MGEGKKLKNLKIFISLKIGPTLLSSLEQLKEAYHLIMTVSQAYSTKCNDMTDLKIFYCGRLLIKRPFINGPEDPAIHSLSYPSIDESSVDCQQKSGKLSRLSSVCTCVDVHTRCSISLAHEKSPIKMLSIAHTPRSSRLDGRENDHKKFSLKTIFKTIRTI